METIHLTDETRDQYLADCRADARRRAAEKRKADLLEPLSRVKHSREMPGYMVYVPPALLDYRFSRWELRALRVKVAA